MYKAAQKKREIARGAVSATPYSDARKEKLRYNRKLRRLSFFNDPDCVRTFERVSLEAAWEEELQDAWGHTEDV